MVRFFKADRYQRSAPIAVGLSISKNDSTTFRKTRFASSALARLGYRAKVHHSIINCKIEISNGPIHTGEQQLR
jgi:hypothetical protein